MYQVPACHAPPLPIGIPVSEQWQKARAAGVPKAELKAGVPRRGWGEGVGVGVVAGEAKAAFSPRRYASGSRFYTL